MNSQLETLIQKIRQLPEERQAAAVEALQVIAAQTNDQLTEAEIDGIKRAQDAVRRGEYASDDAVRTFFARYRA